MPKTDGNSFAKKLYQTSLNKKIPLIALSSLSDDQYNISNNFKTHLLKPIKESKLKQLLIDVIASQSYSSKKIINSEIMENNESTQSTSLPKKLNKSIKILLVEDVIINQKVIINFLKKLGYNDLDIAENGEECLKKLTHNSYDLLLLDIRLPIIDGEQVFYYINEYYKSNKYKQYKFINNKKPYIIAMTAYSLKEDRAKYINIGFDDYIPKPININDLKLCIEKSIEKMKS